MSQNWYWNYVIIACYNYMIMVLQLHYFLNVNLVKHIVILVA